MKADQGREMKDTLRKGAFRVGSEAAKIKATGYLFPQKTFSP